MRIELVAGMLLGFTACAQAPVKPEPEAAPVAAATKPAEPAAAPSASPAEAVPAAPVAQASPAPETPAAPAAQPKSSGIIFGGLLNLSLQNWTRVGETGDSRIGLGFAGDLLIGMPIADMKLLVGPHFGYNGWSADYSTKANSATDRVTVDMSDVGVGFLIDFGDMYFQMGAGSSTLSSSMFVGNTKIDYSFSGTEYSYKMFGIGFRSGATFFGLGGTLYDGYARYADRVEFKFGFGFF